MVVFKINNKDYADHIIAGTYTVNFKPIYKEWVDNSRVTHRRMYRQKVSGSFEMFFRTVEDFLTFRQDCNTTTTANGSIPVNMTVNGFNLVANYNVFLDYEVTRDRDGKWADYFKKFTVRLEEA